MANALDRFIAGAWLIKGLDDGVHSTQPLLREVGRADSFVQFTALGGTAISNPCVKSSLIGRPSDGTKTPRLCSFRLARGVHDSESCFSSRPMINTRSPSLSYSSYTVGDGNTRRRLNTVSCVPTRSGDGSRSFRLFRFHVSEAIPPPRNPSDTCSSSSNSSMCLWNLLIENRRCVCVCVTSDYSSPGLDHQSVCAREKQQQQNSEEDGAPRLFLIDRICSCRLPALHIR